MSKIITFYSYKGGVGRTMCLANTAFLLASWDYKVLMIDWDLEAPGLENFFRQYINPDKTESSDGLIDLLVSESPFPGKNETGANANTRNWKNSLITIPTMHKNGRLDMLTAGNRSNNYAAKLRSFIVKDFYENKNGGELIETWREEWKANYDFILIDSRTGITEIGGICTVQLPDILVLLFTATEHGFTGVQKVAAKAMEAQKRMGEGRVRLSTLPIPTRIDNSEKELTEKWMDRFVSGSDHLYRDWLPQQVDRIKFLTLTKVPYKAYYSFGESLPVSETTGMNDTGGPGYAYQSIAALLATELNFPQLLSDNRSKLLRMADQAYMRQSAENIFAGIMGGLPSRLPGLVEEASRAKDTSPNTSLLNRTGRQSLISSTATLLAKEFFQPLEYIDADYAIRMEKYLGGLIADNIPNLFKPLKWEAEDLRHLTVAVKDNLGHLIDRKCEQDKLKTNELTEHYGLKDDRKAQFKPQPKNMIWRYIAIALFAVAIALFVIFNKTSTQPDDHTKAVNDSLQTQLKIAAYRDSAFKAFQSYDTASGIKFLNKVVQFSTSIKDSDALIASLQASLKYDSTSGSMEDQLRTILKDKYGESLFKVDVFYSELNKDHGQLTADSVIRALDNSRNFIVRKRMLGKRAGIVHPHLEITKNTIRYNTQTEYQVATTILTQLAKAGVRSEFSLERGGSSLNYISIFVQ